MMKKGLAWLGMALLLLSLPARAVVILQYHHVSNSTPASTSVTPAQFQTQMTYLSEQGFNVISLETALTAIRAKQALPAKSVAITFDDGYQSIAANAHPILRQHGFPYTVFVNVAPIEQGYRNIMGWETLRQLSRQGATIANHSYQHDHLIRQQAGEDDLAWQQRIRTDIERTETAITEQIGHHLKALAYPYGEYNPALQNLLEQLGFAGIGQHSGAAGPYSNLTAIPRFPVAGPYADLNTLKVKLHSLNMPVVALDGAGSELIERRQPSLTVTLTGTDVRKRALMCYVQGQGAKAPQWLDDNTFSIQADLPLPAGRSRYNCTAPSLSQSGYYWFSQPWVQANSDGSWPQE
ncbi:polysaccharide deacetylase family protein [uncultured Ferrimonas sp.]|uniref:polysaccharide deacetylase family protein n=1 Tax=uncultured Ferrimonas sp. TaxID=432640 RepID=UPI00261F4AFA|nr:polysaccharide deacetylase family protein [uncultured Ferrimonas sp.]